MNRLRYLYAVHIRWRVHQVVRRLIRFVGMPSPYYDGLPAATELESIEAVFDRLGLPREVPCPDGDMWPLCPRQRAKLLEERGYQPAAKHAG